MGFILGEMRGIPTPPPPQATWRNSLEIPQTKPLLDASPCLTLDTFAAYF